MRNLILIAALLGSPALAQQPIRLGNGDYLARISYQELKAPEGRARLMAAVQRAAATICRNVRPRSDARACEARIVNRAEADSLPQVADALRLARVEARNVQMASR